MFKKSKRAFKQRIRISDSDEEETTKNANKSKNENNDINNENDRSTQNVWDSNAVVVNSSDPSSNDCSKSNDSINFNNKSSGKTDTKTKLSFGFDEEEEDVFVIKKSVYSRRMERNKKKLLKTSLSSSKNENLDTNDKIVHTINKEETTIDLNEVQNEENSEIICPDSDENIEENEVEYCGSKKSSGLHQFRNALERGYIPDAKVIYELKKQRQKLARTVNEEFIPLNNNNDADTENKSRLLREDDEDKSDDENMDGEYDDEDHDRIQFGNVDYQTKEREKAKEQFRLAQEDQNDESKTNTESRKDSDDDDDYSDRPQNTSDQSENSEDEIERWEREKIRKAVGLPSLMSFNESEFNNRFVNGKISIPMVKKPFAEDNHNVVPIDIDPQEVKSYGSYIPSYISEYSKKKDDNSFELITNKIYDAKEKLKTSIEDYKIQYDRICLDLKLISTNINLYDSQKQNYTDDYNFYRSIMEFVQNLFDCINDKLEELEKNEKEAQQLMQNYSNKLMEQYRTHVQDLSSMCLQLIVNHQSNVSLYQQYTLNSIFDVYDFGGDTNKRARVIQNETKYRKYYNTNIENCLSSDDEEDSSDSEVQSYRQQISQIEQKLSQLYEDVDEDYSSVGGILQKFKLWKQKHLNTYCESFITDCISKFIVYYIRHEIVLWNIFDSKWSTDIFKLNSFRDLLIYSASNGDNKSTADSKFSDDLVDINLMPIIIDSIVLPRIMNQTTNDIWNPLSFRQTKRLVQFLTSILSKFPTLIDTSKNLPSLLQMIALKLEKAIENEIFIPQMIPASFFSSQADTSQLSSYESSVTTFVINFFERQYWKAAKLMRNVTLFKDIIDIKLVKELALNKICNRYLLMSIQRCSSNSKLMLAKIKHLISIIPSEWCRPPEPVILRLADCIQQLIESTNDQCHSNGSISAQLMALKVQLTS